MAQVIDHNIRGAEVLEGKFVSRRWWATFTAMFERMGLDSNATLNFPNTAAATSSDLTIAVRGAKLGDYVEVAPPLASILANSFYWAFVSNVDEVTVRFCNFSAGAINPASGIFAVRVKRG
jgi:hypothetical protein